MATIRTFELAWPMGSTIRNLTCALGTIGPNMWILIRTSEGEDEYEPLEWCSIASRAAAEEFPAPSASGNPVFALKNYSENKGVLERLEKAGVIRHTGRRIPQGYVQLEMVEVLIPREELMRRCGECEQWEEVGEPRFLKLCSNSEDQYVCQECQEEGRQ